MSERQLWNIKFECFLEHKYNNLGEFCVVFLYILPLLKESPLLKCIQLSPFI